jgi:micrococcal nuclease
VIDGDTIDVEIDGEEFRVRYVGVNTPERDEPCYWEAWQANRRLVEGQIVTLVRDVSETDRYGRLLRYVYLGGLPINETLVREGYAEVVVYGDDDRFAASFQELEEAASRRNLNCHATGIFNDGSYVR